MVAAAVPGPVTRFDGAHVSKLEAAPLAAARQLRSGAAGELISQGFLLAVFMTENVRADLAPLPAMKADDLLASENGSVKQTESFAVTGADDLEGAVAGAPITVNCEMMVEARRLGDRETLHDGKASAIDQREVLVRK